LRRSPYLTFFPASLEDPEGAAQPETMRFRDPAWEEPPARGDPPGPDGDEPLVYVTFGSVAGGIEMAAHVYGAAIEAVAGLPVRALLTIGREADPGAFTDVPPNVRIERWVPQAEVLPHASAVVCHGGAGSTLGALAAGLPIVAVPLFADQPDNARRVEAVGAGVSLPPAAAAIREGLRRVLDDGSYLAAAQSIARELRTQPAADTAVEVLADLAVSATAGR
jgi:MGT family glycosyltransferase